jgi:hypothetical protein
MKAKSIDAEARRRREKNLFIVTDKNGKSRLIKKSRSKSFDFMPDQILSALICGQWLLPRVFSAPQRLRVK